MRRDSDIPRINRWWSALTLCLPQTLPIRHSKHKQILHTASVNILLRLSCSCIQQTYLPHFSTYHRENIFSIKPSAPNFGCVISTTQLRGGKSSSSTYGTALKLMHQFKPWIMLLQYLYSFLNLITCTNNHALSFILGRNKVNRLFFLSMTIIS